METISNIKGILKNPCGVALKYKTLDIGIRNSKIEQNLEVFGINLSLYGQEIHMGVLQVC